MAQCHDMRSSNDSYRVLQVDDEGGQGKTYAKKMSLIYTQIIGVYCFYYNRFKWKTYQ